MVDLDDHSDFIPDTQDDHSDFVPDQPIAPSVPPEQFSELESAGRGLMQSGTFGFGDELTGGAQALVGSVQGEQGSLEDLYNRYRDIQRAKNEEAAEQNPKSYMAGEIGGTMALGALNPTLAGGKLLSSAALGGLSGFGQSKKESVGEAALDTGIGVASGVIGHGASKLIGKLVSPKAMKDVSDEAAFKASRASATEAGADFKNPEKALEKIRSVGRTAKKEKLIPYATSDVNKLGKVSQSLNKLEKEELQPMLNVVKSGIDVENLPPNKYSMISKLDEAENALKNTLGESDISLKGEIDNVIKSPDYESYTKRILENEADPIKLNEIKRELYSRIVSQNKKAYQDVKVAQELEVYKNLARTVRQQIEDLGELVQPGLGKRIAGVNEDIGNVLNIQKGLSSAAKGESQNPALPKFTKMGMFENLISNKIAPEAQKVISDVSGGIAKVTGYDPLIEKGLGALSKTPLRSTVIRQAESLAGQSPTTRPEAPSKELRTKGVSDVSNKGNDELKLDSLKLFKNEKTKRLGAQLYKAIQDGNQTSIDSIRHLIEQNPEARAVIKGEE